MFKLIPREENTQRSSVKSKDKKMRPEKKDISPKIRQKKDIEKNGVNKVLKRISLQLVKFASDNKGYSSRQISDMVHDLQQGICCLEKKRQLMIWTAKRKKKAKS